jgi:hypothetical protein
VQLKVANGGFRSTLPTLQRQLSLLITSGATPQIVATNPIIILAILRSALWHSWRERKAYNYKV